MRASASVARVVAAGRSRVVGSPGEVLARERRSWWAAGLALVAAALALLTASATAQASEGTAAVAWGSDGHYELGTGYMNVSPEGTPRPVIGLTGIKQVVATGQSSFALLSNGTVMAWGSNQHNELGVGHDKGGMVPNPLPVLLKETPGPWEEGQSDPALTGVTEVAASYGAYTHGLAIVDDSEHEGEVVTWGASEFGERGNGESGFQATKEKELKERWPYPRGFAMFVPELKHIVAVAAGTNADFALQEVEGATTLWAWGANENGKLGIETYEGEKCKGEGGERSCETTPQKVHLPKGVKVTAISASGDAAYAVLSSGEVLAWGSNEHGELGNGEERKWPKAKSNVPVYVCAVGAKAPCGPGSYLQGIKTVAAGTSFALALTEGGDVVGWGDDAYGQLTGTPDAKCNTQKELEYCQLVPKDVTGLEDVTALAAGNAYSVALSGGVVYDFGDDEGAQLGLSGHYALESCTAGEVKCSRVPLKVEGLAPVGGISAANSEGPKEGHTLVYVESGSGPTPLVSATPEDGAILVTWTVENKDYFRIGWKVAPPREEATEEGGGGEAKEGEETEKEKEEREKAEKEKEEKEKKQREEEEKLFSFSPFLEETCSVEHPCTETIPDPKSSPLLAQPYEVSFQVWELKKNGSRAKLGERRFGSVKPLES